MSWARYDDQLPMNKKWAKLRGKGVNGAAALGLHLLANTYCRHNGTGGLVEPHVVEMLVGKDGIKLAGLLVEVGMFDVCEGGWTIHDYAEFHDPNDPDPDRSAAQRQKELSAKRAESGQKGGRVSASNRQAKSKGASILLEANREANGEQTSTPDPVPDPVPTTSSSSINSESLGASPDDDFVSNVIGEIARLRGKANAKTNPSNYAKTTITNFRATEMGDLHAFLAARPELADDNEWEAAARIFEMYRVNTRSAS